jgi:trk system potassium uptake protein TrkA
MNIIIIGCGRMGASLAQALVKRGNEVAVVDCNPAAFERLGSAFGGKIVPGIGFDRAVLAKAGIERADGLAAVTDSDETNVVVARVARKIFRVPKVVARLYDPRKAEIYRRLGLQTISQTTWGVGRVLEILTSSGMETILTLGNGEVEIVEIEVPHLLIGRTVSELTVPGEIHVTAITRGGKAFLPSHGTEFQGGDLVHLTLLFASAERLKALLGWQ